MAISLNNLFILFSSKLISRSDRFSVCCAISGTNKEKKPNIKRMINDIVKIEAIFLLNFNFLTKNITNGLPINDTTAAKKIYKIIDFKR